MFVNSKYVRIEASEGNDMTSPEDAKRSGKVVRATHGNPKDYNSCGEHLSQRACKGGEMGSIVCLAGRIFTCPVHGKVYVDVYVG